MRALINDFIGLLGYVFAACLIVLLCIIIAIPIAFVLGSVMLCFVWLGSLVIGWKAAQVVVPLILAISCLAYSLYQTDKEAKRWVEQVTAQIEADIAKELAAEKIENKPVEAAESQENTSRGQ